MTCLEFQGLMIRYINGELSYKEKEKFMEHVESCADCKEEMEIYYIILTSMKQLDEDRQLSDDFHAEYLRHLKKTAEELASRRKARVRRRMAFPVVVGAAVLFTGLSITDTEEMRPPVEPSTYEMKFRFYGDERHRMFEPAVTEQKINELKKLWEKSD